MGWLDKASLPSLSWGFWMGKALPTFISLKSGEGFSGRGFWKNLEKQRKTKKQGNTKQH